MRYCNSCRCQTRVVRTGIAEIMLIIPLASQSPGFVAVDKGKVPGVRLFLRWNLNHNGKTIKAIRPLETATPPDARGKGIFKKLSLHGLEVAN